MKRILSMMLAALMILAAVPVIALAEARQTAREEAATRSPDFTWDFESESQLADFTAVDEDGDWENWKWRALAYDGSTYPHHGGNGYISSSSKEYADGQHNKLISPAFTGDSISFWVNAQDPNYKGDNLYLQISVDDGATWREVNSFNVISTTPQEYVYNIKGSSFEGKRIRFALYHSVSKDYGRVVVDDITITNCSFKNTDPNTIVWDFESDFSWDGFTRIDNDGDGYSWRTLPNANLTDGDTMQGYFCARSYYNRLSNVDNVMITPQFRGGGSVSFLYCCGNEKAGTAHLEIFVSKDGGRSWSEEPIEALDVLDTAALTCTIDLSAYARKKIQLMFRHCKVKNENHLFIDDIRITLPKAETTTDVTLEFGAEHADMAAQFTGMDGYTVSGSTVTVPVIAKNVKEAREELGLLLLDKFAGPTGTVLTDNGERLHDPLDHAAALNPLSYYSSNYGIETEDSVAISSGKKFYVLWEKPLAGAVITLIPPEVGDTIEMDTGDQSDAEASDPGPTYVSSGLTVLSDSLVWYNSYDPDKDSFDYIFYGEIGYRLYYTEIYLKPGFGYYAEDLSNCVTVYGCHKYWWIADSSGWTRLVAAVCPHSDEPFVPSVVSHSLLLGGDIGVKFYMDLSGLDASEREGCYMVFTVQDEEYTVDFDPDNMNQTGIYYGFTCRVNALQMAEDITAVFHYTVDGEELEIEAAPYSVRTYIDSMLEKKEALSGSTIELITAIGNYGHYAQLFLAEANGFMIGENGEGDYAAMPLYDGTQFEDVYFYGYIDVSGYGIVRDIGESENGEEVVKSITFSLDLLSSTTVKVYFNPAPGHSISAAFNYEPGLNTTEPDWEGGWTESGRPVLEIRNIPAHLLNRTYRFEVECNSDEDRVICQIEVSALSYVNAVLNATEGPLATRNAKCAAAALYYYYMAMLGYTGSL